MLKSKMFLMSVFAMYLFTLEANEEISMEVKVYQEIATQEITDELEKHFYQTDIERKGVSEFGETTSFTIKNELSQIVSSLYAYEVWGALHIEYVWTHENYRNRGYSTKLFEAACEYGKQRGCTFAYLETMDYLALDFYLKRGFEIEFVRHGHSHDCVFYSLRKDFSA